MKPLIDIVVDGKPFAMRNTWDSIPRVGDTVILKRGDVWVEVTGVFWSDDSQAEATRLERQWVQLLCKTIPDPTKPTVPKDRRCAALEREVRYLRHYGNKDCTRMADAAMEQGELDR